MTHVIAVVKSWMTRHLETIVLLGSNLQLVPIAPRAMPEPNSSGTMTPWQVEITELTELINPYNSLDRNYPTEPHRNRAEPISNPSWPRVPFSSTVVPSLVPM